MATLKGKKAGVPEIKELLKQLDVLRGKYPMEHDHATFDGWESELKSIAEVISIKDATVFKRLIARAQDDLKSIEERLQTETSEKLPDVQRDGLIERKIQLNWFISDFMDLEGQANLIKDEIFKALSDFNENYSQGDET